MARAGELSAGMAVLWLLAERSDTAAGIGVRLREEFPDASWQRSIGHNTLPGLIARGHVRVAGTGTKGALDWLEITEPGRECLTGWVNEATVALPVLRESRLAKLRMLEDETQLAAQVRDIWAEADLCARKGDEAKRRYERVRREARLRPPGLPAWKVRTGHAVLRHQATFWLSEAARLRKLAHLLQGEPRFDEDSGLEIDG